MSVRFGTHRNAVLSAWRDAASVGEVEELQARATKIVVSEQGAVGLILLVLDGVKPSPKPARDAAMRMLRTLGTNVAYVAIVIEGEGFGTAALRAMFNGIAVALRPGFPWRIVGRLDDLVEWQPMGQLATPRDMYELEQTFSRLEDEVRSAPQRRPRSAEG